jgi:hypothetical protein
MTERPKPQTREEQAKLEIGQTEISLGVKWALVVVGLLTLFAVPAVQTYHEMRQHAESQRENPWPQCFDIFDAVPRAATAYREHNGSWFSKIFRGNAVLLQAIDKYEKDLKAESFLTQFALPPTQESLVYAGSGNEKSYVGRQRWLFYRPGIDYRWRPRGRKRQVSTRIGCIFDWTTITSVPFRPPAAVNEEVVHCSYAPFVPIMAARFLFSLDGKLACFLGFWVVFSDVLSKPIQVSNARLLHPVVGEHLLAEHVIAK